MIDTSRGGGRAAPEVGEAVGKQRTISCSTEESGVESLSPTESCCPSSECSSPPTTAPHSEPESETSDYQRNTPSPGSSGKNRNKACRKSNASNGSKCFRNTSSNSRDIESYTQDSSYSGTNGQKIGCQRRATVPPCSGAKLQNLKVSLHKLSLPLDALGTKLDIKHCNTFRVSNEMCRKFSDKKRETKRSSKSDNSEKNAKKVKLESSNTCSDTYSQTKCSQLLPPHPPPPSQFGQPGAPDAPNQTSQAGTGDSKCNSKVLPKQLNTVQLNSKVVHGSLHFKSESLEESKANLSRNKSLVSGLSRSIETDSKLKAKTEDMKLEIAKIDSILQGNLLLDKSSHKISDILLLDKFKSSYSVKQEIFSAFDCQQDNKRFDCENLQLTHNNAIASDVSAGRGLSCEHGSDVRAGGELACEHGNSSQEEEIDVVTIDKCSISVQENLSSKYIVSSEESINSNASNEGCGLSNESCDLSSKGIKLSNRRRFKQNEESRVSQGGLDNIVESVVDENTEFIACKWEGCGQKLEVQHLLEHLTGLHVYKQTMSVQTESDGRVQCLWAGCKVYGTWSTSRTWLSKHVTSHVGSKPFQCIVDGCRQRFGSQVSLSRHVNSHFKPPCVPTNHSSSKKNSETTPIKFYIRKNRRKNKSIAAPVSNSGMDLFDIGIMAGIKDGLSKIKKKPRGQRKKPSELNFDSSGSSIIFHSQINSRKLDENGNIHYLISWFPLGMLKDEWVCEEEFKTRKKVLISQLPQVTKAKIEDHIFGKRSKAKILRKPPKHYGPPKLT